MSDVHDCEVPRREPQLDERRERRQLLPQVWSRSFWPTSGSLPAQRGFRIEPDVETRCEFGRVHPDAASPARRSCGGG